MDGSDSEGQSEESKGSGKGERRGNQQEDNEYQDPYKLDENEAESLRKAPRESGRKPEAKAES